MPSVRDLRDRIRSLKNTQQITKAMKQVAAAKIRRADALCKQTRPYAAGIAGMLHDLIENVGVLDHPFMKPGNAQVPKGVILITADKGLCGAFNGNLVRAADFLQREHPRVLWYPVGNKARNGVRRLPQTTVQSWPLSHVEKSATAREVAVKVTEDFMVGKIGEIVLIAPKLISTMVQRPEMKTLVPIAAVKAKADMGLRAVLEFSPSPEAVLTRLLPKYLEFTLFSAMLETEAAFFSAQLIAMNNATENAGKLIDELTIVMNKARQAAITKEMLEIVGGAEALTG
jgi:F-type H+-transporting ATPase subunit gamma